MINSEHNAGMVSDFWKRFVRLFYKASPVFSRVIEQSVLRAPALRLCEGEVYEDSARETIQLLEEEFNNIRRFPNHPLRTYLTS